MSFNDLPDELIRHILEYVPLSTLKSMSSFDSIAFNLLFKDIHVSKQLQGYNVFDNLRQLKFFIEQNPQFDPYHLIVDSQSQLGDENVVSRFKFVSINHATTIPSADYKYRSIVMDLSDCEDVWNTSRIRCLDVEDITIIDGEPGTAIPTMAAKLSLICTPTTIKELESLEYLKALSLHNSLSEPFTGTFPYLESLTIDDYSKNGDLTNLTSLKYLDISDVNDLKCLPPNLHTLKVSDGQKLNDLTALETASCLKSLHLSLYYACNYSSFYKVKYPPLTELSINFDNIYFDIYHQINSIHLPETLKSLSLSNCEDLCLDSIRLPQGLDTLKVSNILEFDVQLNRDLRVLRLHDVLEVKDLTIPSCLEVLSS